MIPRCQIKISLQEEKVACDTSHHRRSPFPSYLNLLLHCSLFCRMRIPPVIPSQSSKQSSLSTTLLNTQPTWPNTTPNTSPKAFVGKMDSTKIEKLQAMKRYGRRHHFIRSLVQYLAAVILLGLFLSSPLWLPTIYSSLKLFYFVLLPNLCAIVFGPKFLFIVCNLIVVFLIGESKLSKSSLTHDIYEEYMNRTTNLRRLSTSESKQGSEFEKAFTEEGEEGEEEKGGGREEEAGGYEDLDELNRRVEDFIARVNKQRRLEASILRCYG